MQEVSADFKNPSGVLTVSFKPMKVPGTGTEAAAAPEDGKKIIDMVLQSKEIAFRTERKQGKFEVIAAKETLELLGSYCSS